MPIKKVKYDIEYLQIIDEEGNADQSLMPKVSEDEVKEMYHLMALARAFDEKLFKLQRSGKIGTYAEIHGEEASEVGSSFALQKDDWMIPSFREMAAFLTRGADRTKIVQSWRGDVRAFDTGPDTKSLPIAIPIASQLLHATGIAWASKIRKEKNCALVYFGDGATSEGDFHEALNFAGVLKAPVIFFCQNNQWAISTPRTKQTASETIAQKAIAYGIKSIQIDGNDVISSYKATLEALERARNGEGPTLIESITYRVGDHTTSDDSSKYRKGDEIEEWKKKDPLLRIEKYFKKIGTWTDDYGKWVKDEVEREVNEAVEAALKIEPPSPEDVFVHIFDKLPPILENQEKELMDELGDQK